jgi:GTP cyclohydrolase IA
MMRTSPAQSLPHTEPAIDFPRIERAVREILFAIGEDPARDGLRETPQRVARALGEVCGGSRERARMALTRQFHISSAPRVTVKRISFVSVCEHHLLPFRGHARVTYVPAGGRVVGLSKLTRALRELASRPQLQERLTEEFVELIAETTAARFVEVELEATHDCLCMRGASEPTASMVTTAQRSIPAPTDCKETKKRGQKSQPKALSPE